jgi:DNA replication protein DnaC
VAIDEMGKEQFKKGDSWIRLQVERILKQRFDESLPTLIATNAESEKLGEVYGATLTSIFDGKYTQATFNPGDFRVHLRDRMAKDLGI